MKKYKSYLAITLTLLVFVGAGVLAYFIEGNGMRNTHFVRLEMIPKVEFITDNDNIVNSVYPVNKQGKIVLCEENYIGVDLIDAISKFLLDSARLGYFDMEGDNAIQISVSSSFTQSLENKVYSTCNKFFIENEILCVIAESDADRALFEEKKEKSVTTIEKLVIIKSVLEKTSKYTFENLNKLTESAIIDILEEETSAQKVEMNNKFIDCNEEKNEKLAHNEEEYSNHISKITNETQKEFAKEYTNYKLEKTTKFELDFASEFKKLRS